MTGSWIQNLLHCFRLGGLGLLAVAAVFPAKLAPDSTKIIELNVSPPRIYLFGLQTSQRITVTAVYADGTEADVTKSSLFAVSDESRVTISEAGLLEAGRSPGLAILTATFGGRKRTVRISVLEQPGRLRIDFERDVVPVLTMMGCNGANCHGSIHGKNGFKLSTFGYEAQQDYEMIVHEANGRRVNLSAPLKSLILQKPTFQIAHGGGKRFAADSPQYQVLLEWLKEGAPGPSRSLGTHIERLEVFPAARVMPLTGAEQQLVVLGHFSDGTSEDFTDRVAYASLDDGVLQVDKNGVVKGLKPGEATILIRAPGAVAASHLAIRYPGRSCVDSFPKESNFIDDAVVAKLRRMNVRPSGLVSDEGFVRRVFLDTLGILPSGEEVSGFLADADPHKRALLINNVLERPEYAEYWGLMWADLLTVTSFKSGASDPLHLDLWIRDQFRRNVTFDRVARTLVAGTGPVQLDPGVGLTVARTPEEAAGFYSQLFLGVRMQCAQCHDHPFEKWRRSDFYGMAAFFSQVAQKPTNLGTVVYDDPTKEFKSPVSKALVTPVFPGGQAAPRDGRSYRQVFADWLTSRDNPYFARAIVNRVWKHYMHVGLVEPVDDFRETNPPSNAALLDRLAGFFIASGFDMKELDRSILNSTTYQLSSEPNETNQSDERLYSRYYYRRLTAEPLLDAVSQVTEVRHRFRFGYEGMRAVQLHNPAMFDEFLQAFDRNRRESVCEREENHTLLQTLEMVSGDAINEKIRDSPLVERLVESGASDRQALEEVYVRAFSRRPLREEADGLETLFQSGRQRRQVLEDLLWAVLNSKEFLFNH